MPLRRPNPVEPKQVIFIGVEGKSDRAFAQFLQRCCDEECLHLHVDIETGHGGDSVVVVQEAARHLTRHPGKQDISAKLVLLDSDRIRKTGKPDAMPRPWRPNPDWKSFFRIRIWKGCCSGFTKDARVGKSRRATQ